MTIKVTIYSLAKNPSVVIRVTIENEKHDENTNRQKVTFDSCGDKAKIFKPSNPCW